MAFKNKIQRSIVVMALLLGQSAAFADNRITVDGISITGGGLQLIGTISTTTADDKNPALGYIGWGLIVVGSLVNGGHIANAAEAAVPASDVWSAMVRESRVYSHNPSLIKSDTAIANAASSMGIQPKDLAQLVLELDARAANAKAAKVAFSTDDLAVKYFPNGLVNPVQRQAFNNLTALSSMI